MIIKYTLKINNNKIYFGIANREEEILEIFKQRSRVYVDRGYIKSTDLEDGLEKDSYDKYSKYIVAYNECGRLIGSVRIIICKNLPIFNSFKFDMEDVFLKKLNLNNLAEISRLIVERSLPEDQYIPRNIIMIFMIKVILDIAIEDRLEIGFAYLRKSLWKKMRLLKMPFVEISNYKCIYPKDGVMSEYFYKDNESIIPVYFNINDFSYYITTVLENKRIFINYNKIYVLNNSLYTKFLKQIKVL